MMIKSYNNTELPAVDIEEIWRYAGYLGVPDENEQGLKELLAEVMETAGSLLAGKIIYSKMPELPFSCQSEDLRELLSDCDSVYLFAATIGFGIDRLIALGAKSSPLKELLYEAWGTERIETLCDCFCAELKETERADGKILTKRFSPGYGDLPIDAQKDIFEILACEKAGIFLNEGLTMRPTKSVTAIIGVSKAGAAKQYTNACSNKCDECTLTGCSFKK